MISEKSGTMARERFRPTSKVPRVSKVSEGGRFRRAEGPKKALYRHIRRNEIKMTSFLEK
jgi:hypothetical protein